MLTQSITALTIVLVGQAAVASAAAATPKQKVEFMRAMKSSDKKRNTRQLNKDTEKEFKKTVYGTSKESSALRKKIIEKAVLVKPAEGGDARKLANSYYNNQNQNYNANAKNSYNSKTNAENYKYTEDFDGSDDYFMAYGDWENTFGFDATQYALSYNRCAAVRQFDEQLAAQEDSTSVFATKNFAVFRFCPEATCMGFVKDYADCGCESQCAAYETQASYSSNSNYNEEACISACQTQCTAFQKVQANSKRELTYYSSSSSSSNPYSSFLFDFTKNWTPEDDAEVFGARGEGCQTNYGEYMVELTDYLQMMLEFQEERFETYCTYCEECMYKVYQVWLKNGGNYANGNNNRQLSYDEFKSSDERQQMERELGGDVYGGQAYGKYYNVCPEYDTCTEYKNMCDNDSIDEHLTQYFTCTEVTKNNGVSAYVGPHCAKDGFTVTLGVFSDANCYDYIGNSVDIGNFIGEEMDIESDALKAWYNSANGPLDMLQFSNEDDVCIPCRNGDMLYEDLDDANNDEVAKICENLYMASARCDKHFRSYNTRTSQAKYAEAVAQEDLACDFINTVVMGNYDEMGFLNSNAYAAIESQNGWFSETKKGVTPIQIFGLVASLSACAIFAVWSMTLHQSLSKRGPWRPRRYGANAIEPIDRQNSGIVMGRSQSNGYYLD